MNHLRIINSATVAAGFVAGLVTTSSVRADERYEYGEYLSGECTTCHQISGHADGIPPITGWPVETFVVVLESYREGSQENEAMISVAKRLTDEEIQALAVFFHKQGKQE